MPAPKTDGFAITSLVLGCLGWVSFPGFFMAILAVVFGFLAQNRIKRTPGLQGKGLATAGIILGFIFGAFWIVVFIFVFAVFSTLGNY